MGMNASRNLLTVSRAELDWTRAWHCVLVCCFFSFLGPNWFFRWTAHVQLNFRKFSRRRSECHNKEGTRKYLRAVYFYVCLFVYVFTQEWRQPTFIERYYGVVHTDADAFLFTCHWTFFTNPIPNAELSFILYFFLNTKSRRNCCHIFMKP